ADLEGLQTVGITAGASAPEELVEEVIEEFRKRFDLTVETVTTANENIAFNVPRELRAVSTA
ncbi:MAG: 4-hydroxy-3-methylbut-2-enyl diphosphate reductase, partial [Hyphomicrobium sp.]